MEFVSPDGWKATDLWFHKNKNMLGMEEEKKENEEGAWSEDKWPDVECRSESKHPNSNVERDWDLNLWEETWEILALYQHWAIYTKSFILSGDGKFECRTPVDLTVSGSHLPSSAWAPLLWLCQHCHISTEVASYTDKTPSFLNLHWNLIRIYLGGNGNRSSCGTWPWHWFLVPVQL